MNEQNMQLASELRGVIIRLYKKMRRKSVSAEKLSLTERSTLAHIFHNPNILASELAAMEQITTQSMSQILNHLAEMDLIIRVPSETDKRKVLISISPLGDETIQKARLEKDEWLRKILSENFSDDERAILSKAIAPLTKLVNFD